MHTMSAPLLLALLLVGMSPLDVPTELQDGGFESPSWQEHWSLHVYGAPPSIALDTDQYREGRQSLRVTAAALSDTAFGQEIQLTPGRWYRLTGWIRTEDLDPHDAPVCGTLQVQYPGGQGVVASGRNHRGTTDWTRETVYFTPPGQGRTRIALFLVGYGQGTGTAWFDGLTIEAIPDAFTCLQLRCQAEP